MKPVPVASGTIRTAALVAWILVFMSASLSGAADAGGPEPRVQASDTLQTSAPRAQSPITSPAEGQPAASINVDSALEEARASLDATDYERAIGILEPMLETTRFNPERLRETYLLLIKAYVFGGNNKPADTKDQRLWYEAADRLTRECLSVRDLRHTRPDPPESYPDLMVQLFNSIRLEMFGTFEIKQLEPVDAEVTFDGELLARNPEGKWRAEDVPIGSRMLVIRHHDYHDLTADISIEAARTVSETYALQGKKGWGWYTKWIAAPVVGVTALVAWLWPEETPAATEQPLPGPPGPPSN